MVNASEMHKQHPTTFGRPSPDRLAAVTAGSIVKVSDHEERFWVVVTGRNGEFLTGTVDNHLVFSRLKCGDEIQFHTDNIYQIFQGVTA